MANIVYLPEDKSFGSGDALGNTAGGLLGVLTAQRIKQQKLEHDQKIKQDALTKAFDLTIPDNEVAADLNAANIGIDQIVKIQEQRTKAKEDQNTFQTVTGYKYNPDGSSIEQKVNIRKSDFNTSTLEEILNKRGLTSKKQVAAPGGEASDKETAINNAIKAYGGKEDAKTKVAARQLVEERDDITETIASSFSGKFEGNSFTFSDSKDAERFNLADSLIPYLMIKDGTERGEAIDKAVRIANEVIPKEDDMFSSGKEGEGGKETKQEGGKEEGSLQSVIDSLTNKTSSPKSEVLGTFQGKNVEVSGEALKKAEQEGDNGPMLDEIAKQIGGSRAMAVQFLQQNNLAK